MSSLTAVILAAGQGTRMKSTLPKVLHPVCGRPLLHYPVRAALDAGASEVIVVVGHGKDLVTAYLKKAFGDRVKTALQETQRGTGDAAKAALPAISPGADSVLLFYGDVPLLSAEDLTPLLSAYTDSGAALALATCDMAEPFGYGRVLRDSAGNIAEIREQKDLASDNERDITEINPGIYVSSKEFLTRALLALKPENAQREYYLTDIVKTASQEGKPGKPGVRGVPSRSDVIDGVNDREQLAKADAAMARRIVRKHRLSGVTIADNVRIEDGVTIAQDVTLATGVVLRGETSIGAFSHIDVGSVLTDVVVGERAMVKPYSVAQQSTIGTAAQVGPFSHMRPESELGEEAHIGNFVEMKKTKLGKGAKANHLAYLGDGIVGAGANIGAGTIFCNYDGFLKHTTTIEEGAFIGSDSQLVAPVTIGKNAYVATGTTVTKDVPEDALALSRTKQENKEGYAARLRARFRAAKDAKKAGS